MSDECDVESARLDYLNSQRARRVSEILDENAGLDWTKPCVGSDEFPSEHPKVIRRRL